MITLLLHLLRLLPFLCGGHRQLALENLALRHQLTVYKRTVPRPRLRRTDRLLWVGLASAWAGWRQPLLIVTPDTVLRWQRRRFRAHWTRRSGRPRPGRPPISAITVLIKHDGGIPVGRPENPWRTQEARHRVARQTSRLAEAAPPRHQTGAHGPTTSTFSLDFFTVPTARLRVLFVLVVLAHHRRRIVHFNVTEHPTAQWTAQQIVDAFPNDTAPSYLLRDRDQVYGHAFRYRVKGMGIGEILTAPSSPWQNPFAERLIGSIRRECLDHVLVLSEPHLRRILTAYVAYYHRARTHLSLDKDAPDSRPIEPPERGTIIPIPEVGGLHHRYVRRAASSNTGLSSPRPAHATRSSLPSGSLSVPPRESRPTGQGRRPDTTTDIHRASRIRFWRGTGRSDHPRTAPTSRPQTITSRPNTVRGGRRSWRTGTGPRE
jgi:hypothetical protein